MRWVLAFVAAVVSAYAQRATGELRLLVTDPTGLPVRAIGSLASQSTQQDRSIQTDAEGRYTLQALPFGNYTLHLDCPGLAPFSAPVEIRSEVPIAYRATLSLTRVETAVNIVESDTLLDAERTGSANHIGSELIRHRRASAPGRSVLELVNNQPGWLLEANGVLHPRGSEYDVQYVVDGLPVFDNRSPAFAQSLGADEFQSMRVLTGGYPAEYGRKLGGVVEVATERNGDEGLHGRASIQGGSFGTVSGFASLQYRRGRTAVGASGEAFTTDRYLDPPVVENFSNRGSGQAFSFRLEREWNAADRTRAYVTRRRAGFLVPNERLQQQAGQRQDRTSEETSGQFAHEHVFSPRLLGVIQGRVRDTSAGLWSNPLSTPIAPFQDRGFREAYGNASLSGHNGRHEWKTGFEVIHANIHENYAHQIVAYRVLGVRVFDRDIPARFSFRDRGVDNEQSAYAQDTIRFARLTLAAGMRWDRYSLRVNEWAVSPRLGAAWAFPSAGLSFRAAYDRTFQTPAIENILLASADLSAALGGGAFLPLRPSRGDFFEAGVSKTLGGRMRLDGTWFHRSMTNLADDSVLLNTGISFPTAFLRGSIYGFEAKIEAPRWGPFSGFLSWSNLVGRGELPVAGGLFLGDDATTLVRGEGQFPITQDQRNSLRARVRAEVGRRAWIALGAMYNSGLPIEIEGAFSLAVLTQQYGEAVVGRVNFERGRVYPSYSFDASAGAELFRRERRAVRVQADATNLADRLNVINFAGLFSGTAIEAGRAWSVRLAMEF